MFTIFLVSFNNITALLKRRSIFNKGVAFTFKSQKMTALKLIADYSKLELPLIGNPLFCVFFLQNYTKERFWTEKVFLNNFYIILLSSCRIRPCKYVDFIQLVKIHSKNPYIFY